MNAIDRELQAIRERELVSVTPPQAARERGWTRLAASVAAGVPPPVEVVLPPLRRAPWLRVVPLAVLLAVGSLILARPGGDEPAIVAATIELPAEPVAEVGLPPVQIPLAPRSEAAPGAKTPGPTVPRRVAARPAAVEDDDSFAAELRLLAMAQAAIGRGELEQGLRLLRAHARRYPQGHFAQDRDALGAIARCEGGQATARVAGRKFLAAHPESIHAEQVRVACEGG
jgi:hypothetical protein